MKYNFIILAVVGLLASTQAAWNRGNTCPNNQPRQCPSAARQPSCMYDNSRQPLQMVSAYDMTCTCNCCKYTDTVTGRKVDSKSCVMKRAENINEPNEICDCNCPLPAMLQGKSGCQGVVGPRGMDGQDGLPGKPGKKGLHGKPGSSGANGARGEDVDDCRNGGDGSRGIAGVKGLEGSQGPRGMDGKSGSQGPQGVKGLPGPPGKDGPKGLRGPPGDKGPRGQHGVHGKPGQPGLKGKKGAPGAPGLDGRQGADGKPGEQGPPGQPGAPGKDGAKGLPGQPGPRGPYGKPGVQGEPGKPGKDSDMVGQPGEPGDNGMPGNPGGMSASFDWRYVEALVAEQLYEILTAPSEYCDIPEQVCECGERATPTPIVVEPTMDIVLLIDGSDSIDIEDWMPLKDWVIDFIHEYSSQVAGKYSKVSAMVVVQYSSYPEYWKEKRMFDQLKQLDEKLKGMTQFAKGTDTYLALEYVLHDVVDKDFARSFASEEARANYHRNLILLTNGLARDDASRNREFSNAELFSKLDDTFETRVVIGMGSEIAHNDQQVRAFAGDSGRYFSVGHVSELDAELIQEVIGEF